MALTWPEIRENMRQYLVRLTRKTTLAGSSADGRSEQADGYERGPGDPAYGFGLRRMQSYGFASWVPRAAEIVALAINGGKNNRVYVASDLPGAAPTLANEGDTVIYNSKATGGTTTIYMDHSGNITINCTGSGNVILGATDPALCDPVVTKSELNTAIQTVVNRLNSHTHGGVQTGVFQTGTSSSPLYTGYSVSGSPDVVAKKP